MASIEAMTKEAARSLTIRVKRQAAARAELEAAQDMDRRAVSRLKAAETASAALDAEVQAKADIVSRLTGQTAESVLDEIRKELFPEVPDDENAETDADGSSEAPADENPDMSADEKPKRVRKTAASKADAESVSV